MNQISLDKFKNELSQLRAYLQHIQTINEFVGYTPLETDSKEVKELIEKLKNQEITGNFRVNRKIFEYKAVIISLYGTLERTIENWVKEFLDALSGIITDYTKLPDKIKDNHFKGSIDLIKLLNSKDYPKYQHLQKETILKKLNNCIHKKGKYKFNEEAFLLSSGNLKNEKITPILTSLGIDLNQIVLLKDKSESEKKVIHSKIDNLVERRNEVAHGSDNVIDNLLGASSIEEYIENLEIYGTSIFDVLNQKHIQFEAEDSGDFFLVETVHNIWNKDVTRIGVDLEEYTISVGNFIIIRTPENEYLKEKIISIATGTKKDFRVHEKLTIKEKMEVAIAIDKHISNNKEGHKFYLKKKQK